MRGEDRRVWTNEKAGFCQQKVCTEFDPDTAPCLEEQRWAISRVLFQKRTLASWEQNMDSRTLIPPQILTQNSNKISKPQSLLQTLAKSTTGVVISACSLGRPSFILFAWPYLWASISQNSLLPSWCWWLHAVDLSAGMLHNNFSKLQSGHCSMSHKMSEGVTHAISSEAWRAQRSRKATSNGKDQHFCKTKIN